MKKSFEKLIIRFKEAEESVNLKNYTKNNKLEIQKEKQTIKQSKVYSAVEQYCEGNQRKILPFKKHTPGLQQIICQKLCKTEDNVVAPLNCWKKIKQIS